MLLEGMVENELFCGDNVCTYFCFQMLIELGIYGIKSCWSKACPYWANAFLFFTDLL